MRKKATHQHLAEHTKYRQYLLKKGLKLSRARETVFWEVMEAHGHFAAEELVKQCAIRNRGVSRATIYRSLKELFGAAVIRETAFGEKHHHFEHVYDEKLHHHARCIHCYKIIEVPCLQEYKKYLELLKKEHFQVLGHELHFYGTCQNCLEIK
ncbi:MAG: transcriptional repressor [Candidatus Omnitrophica bacterium]|nr:transcriptional repressor [Candidatus Omnitrophota bacterium]